jgi:UDP-glucuronate 4-epimerase
VKILVTGAAGFIGFHTCCQLLSRGDQVHGIDNLNDYYDVGLKEARLELLLKHRGFSFERFNLADREQTASSFSSFRAEVVVNLAAQPGVRYSLENPHAYVDSNVVAFLNVIEGCRSTGIRHLVFASSSSVYGANTRVPFSTRDNVDHPISLYAATKKANELMAHCYSYNFGVPTTGLRFFTVYGPWGRPDMAAFSFTRAILERRPIDVYNHGKMKRDFTYIDDVVEATLRVIERPPAPDPHWSGAAPDPASSSAPYRIYNVGNNCPVELLRFIELLEDALGRKAVKNMVPIQPGDVPVTCANTSDLTRDVGFAPSIPLEVGIPRFVDWYRTYYVD